MRKLRSQETANLCEYVIDREGRVVAAFSSSTKPEDEALRTSIESVL